MNDYDGEPIPGLPGILPHGEQIIWQGSPDWRALARTAFHTRLIAGYFALLAAWALFSAIAAGVRGLGDLVGLAMTLLVGALGVGLLHLLAWASARTTIYTLTDRRIVLRIGIALPKCINLPLALIGTVDLSVAPDGTGDVPMTLTCQQRLGYAALWPHARPWKVTTPQPMLRAVPGAVDIAALIARTCVTANPGGRIAPIETGMAPRPAFVQAVAA